MMREIQNQIRDTGDKTQFSNLPDVAAGSCGSHLGCQRRACAMTPDFVITKVIRDGSGDASQSTMKTVLRWIKDGQGRGDTKAYKPFFTVRSSSTGKTWSVLGARSSGHREQFALLPSEDPQHLAKILGISYPHYPLCREDQGRTATGRSRGSQSEPSEER
jgi:hypothetical protein